MVTKEQTLLLCLAICGIITYYYCCTSWKYLAAPSYGTIASSLFAHAGDSRTRLTQLLLHVEDIQSLIKGGHVDLPVKESQQFQSSNFAKGDINVFTTLLKPLYARPHHVWRARNQSYSGRNFKSVTATIFATGALGKCNNEVLFAKTCSAAAIVDCCFHHRGPAAVCMIAGDAKKFVRFTFLIFHITWFVWYQNVVPMAS
eukprot:scaffold456_cov171-Amphora_coffeaeformis.AAC.13